ncbi:hypothetical protein JW930_07480 [Candidatus Woesearchaeota archaeon]|nr:hypothetical protein [Candidatus Woesearchaeota archaeon]
MASKPPENVIDFLINTDYFGYKKVFNVDERSPEVEDELARKIEEITRVHVVREERREHRIVLDDPHTVTEDTISDVIDAFVGMRNGATLTELNGGSLSRMLIMLNEQVRMKFHEQMGQELGFETGIVSQEMPIAPTSSFEAYSILSPIEIPQRYEPGKQLY